MKQNRHYAPRLKAFARALRRDMTDQERHLWYGYLRHSPVRFFRQYALGDYIVDFCCPRARIVVELDGRQHFTEEALDYDERRGKWLESLGYKVLRYRNAVVDDCIDGVWRQIEAIVKERLGNTPPGASRHPPQRGGKEARAARETPPALRATPLNEGGKAARAARETPPAIRATPLSEGGKAARAARETPPALRATPLSEGGKMTRNAPRPRTCPPVRGDAPKGQGGVAPPSPHQSLRPPPWTPRSPRETPPGASRHPPQGGGKTTRNAPRPRTCPPVRGDAPKGQGGVAPPSPHQSLRPPPWTLRSPRETHPGASSPPSARGGQRRRRGPGRGLASSAPRAPRGVRRRAVERYGSSVVTAL